MRGRGAPIREKIRAEDLGETKGRTADVQSHLDKEELRKRKPRL